MLSYVRFVVQLAKRFLKKLNVPNSQGLIPVLRPDNKSLPGQHPVTLSHTAFQANTAG